VIGGEDPPKTANVTKHNGAAVIYTSLVKFHYFISLFRSLRCFTSAWMPGVQKILAALAATFLGSLPDGRGFFQYVRSLSTPSSHVTDLIGNEY